MAENQDIVDQLGELIEVIGKLRREQAPPIDTSGLATDASLARLDSTLKLLAEMLADALARPVPTPVVNVPPSPMPIPAEITAVLNEIREFLMTPQKAALDEDTIRALRDLNKPRMMTQGGTNREVVQVKNQSGTIINPATEGTLQSINVKVSTEAKQDDQIVQLADALTKLDELLTESTYQSLGVPLASLFGQTIIGSYINQFEARWDKTLDQNDVDHVGNVTVADALLTITANTTDPSSYAESNGTTIYKPLRPLFVAFTIVADEIPTGAGNGIYAGAVHPTDPTTFARLVLEDGTAYFRVHRSGVEVANIPFSAWDLSRLLDTDGLPESPDFLFGQILKIEWGHLGFGDPALKLYSPGRRNFIPVAIAKVVNTKTTTVMTTSNLKFRMGCTWASGNDVVAHCGSWAGGLVDDPSDSIATAIIPELPYRAIFDEGVNASRINQTEARWDKSLASNAVDASGGVTVTNSLLKVTAQSGTANSQAIAQRSINYHPFRPLFCAFTCRFSEIPTVAGNQLRAGMFDNSTQDGIELVAHDGEMHIRITRGGVILHDVPQSEWNIDRLVGQTYSLYGPRDFSTGQILPAAIDWSKIQLVYFEWGYLGVAAPTMYVLSTGHRGLIPVHTVEHVNAHEQTFLTHPNLKQHMAANWVSGSAISVESGSWAAGIIDDPDQYTPGEVAGRTPVDVVLVGFTTGQTLYTVPAGRVFKMLSIGVSLTNTSSTSPVDLIVRDGGVGGTMKAAYSVPVAATLGIGTTAPAAVASPTAFDEPISFSTNVFIQLTGGTPRATVFALGYLDAA